MTSFIETANSRETSPEIMEAILAVAGGDEKRAKMIWEDGGSEEELIAIWERVTNNGLHDATDFFWGSEGSRWANGILAKGN